MAKRVPKSLQQDAFAALHSAGWADRRIGEALSVSPITVRIWRDDRGLPRNPGKCVKIEEKEGRAMYAAGANDQEIARRFETRPSTVFGWRQRRGLPPNVPSRAVPPEVRRKAEKMLRLGASMRQVAEACGLHFDTVESYRSKIKGQGLRRRGLNNRSIRSQVLKDPEVAKRIERAIGSRLPLDVRLEATSSLYLAVLDGLVAVDLIEKVAPSYTSAAFDICGSKFGPRSLDEEVGDEGWTLMDSLEDPHALESMEAAAEAAWNDN